VRDAVAPGHQVVGGRKPNGGMSPYAIANVGPIVAVWPQLGRGTYETDASLATSLYRGAVAPVKVATGEHVPTG